MAHRSAAAYHRQFARHQEQARQSEFLREDISRQVARDTMMAANFQSDERVSSMRRNREMAEAQRMETFLKEREGDQRRHQEEMRLRTQTEKLTQEINARRAVAQRDEKLRQRIREQSEELQGLQNMLRKAQLARDVDRQIEENKVRRAENKAAEAAEDENQTEYFAQLQAADDARTARQRKVYDEGKRMLVAQIKEKEAEKEANYKDFLEEKRLIDESVRKLQEEDQRAREERDRKRLETQQFIASYLDEREQWKSEEQDRIAEEDRKIMEYARIQDEREIKRQEKRRREAAVATAAFNQVAESIRKQEDERHRIDDMRMELAMEEQDAQRRAAERERTEKRLRIRLETMRENEELARMRKEREEKDRVEETALREEMLQKFAEDERITQLNKETRRRKMIEYRKQVDAVVQEKRLLREQERRDAEKELDQEREEQAVRDKIVEDERRRLIRQAASDLLGYVPLDLFKEGDLDGLNEAQERLDALKTERAAQLHDDDEDLDREVVSLARRHH